MLRKIFCLIITGVVYYLPCTGLLHANLIIFQGRFDANGSGAFSNVGEFSVTPSAGDPTTYSFTHTANMDGGTINDTFTFDLVYTMYTGSTFDGNDVTLGSSVALNDFNNPHFMNNYVGDTDTNQVAAGDSFTANITNIVYSSGEGFTSPGVSFRGFNTISKFGDGDDDLLLGTTAATTLAVPTATGAISPRWCHEPDADDGHHVRIQPTLARSWLHF